MPLIHSTIHKYILPVGFALIILMMVISALVTSNRIENNNNTIYKIQIETNEINRLLDIMSSAEYERTVILFQILQNNGLSNINQLNTELNKKAKQLFETRNKFTLYDLTQSQKDLLSLQSKISEDNIETINRLISLLHNLNHKEANLILKKQTLPKIKLLLKVIDDLNEETDFIAKNKVSSLEELSKNEVNNIFSFNLLFILASFILMLFLVNKQNKSDNNLSLLANTDRLTDLPNRSKFIQHINETILEEPNDGFSIIFLDIDYFKSINDNYGHEVGDLVLKLFAITIKKVISNNDMLSRFGGDEFVILLKNKDDVRNIKMLVNKLSSILDTSFCTGNNEVFVSASIGACNYPDDGQTAKDLLKSADVAMYTAKQSGRNCYQFFSIEDSKKLDREHALSHALQTVLKDKNSDKQLSLVYQPLVNIVNNDFNECEALIRWNDQDGNSINTAEFIEIAEKSNLIEKLNTFVIEETCRQQAQWLKDGVDNIRININLSGNKRIFSNLFNSLSDNLSKYELDPKLFGIELTERTMYEISEDTNKYLKKFRDMGMKISIDDFGTGYSSLSYLKELPITSVKIDREFIIGLPTDKIDVALVKAIIALSHSLGFDVIAEGVETQEQFEFLKECHCNIAQGYLLHKPMSSDNIYQLKIAA